MNKRKIIDHLIFFTISIALIILSSIKGNWTQKLTTITIVVDIISIVLSLILSRKIRKIAINAAKKANYDHDKEEFIWTILIYLPLTNSIYAIFLLISELKEEFFPANHDKD